MEYFVIGESEIVTGFMLAGVKGKAVFNRDDTLEIFKIITGQSSSHALISEDEKPKILILTEEAADMIQEEVLEWQMKAKPPLIVEVPGLQGHNPNRKSLTDSIKEAIGIQI